jgi:pimeloyl-ACP methyl ester carboxylesterase
MSDRAIASRLQLSPQTIRWYNKQIYGRLGATTRTQAVALARELGLLEGARSGGGSPPPRRTAIQYVDRDGVSIAWQSIGEGPITLLFIHGFVSHLEIAWEDPEFTAFFELLGREVRVILFDKRGVGLSDRVEGGPSLDETILDACAILDAAEAREAFVFGTSEGGATATLLASLHPERVRGLILFGATAKVTTREAEPTWSRPRERFNERLDLLVATWGEPWALEQFAPSRAGEPTFREWWSRLLRASSSPMSIRRVFANAAEVDIRALLPVVTTPTLVVHRIDDRIIPVAAGRYLAEQLPNATLIELPGPDHIYFVHGESLVRAMLPFIHAPTEPKEPETRIAILLAGTGPLMRLSPERRRLVESCQGRHLQDLGANWIAVFDSPGPSLQAARRLAGLEQGRAPGLALHVGACGATDGRPGHNAAATVAALAAAAIPGQVLLSETLQDILAGSRHRVTPHPFPARILET